MGYGYSKKDTYNMEKNNELSILFQMDRINDEGDFEEMAKTMDEN